jgi:hypothetical protein
MALDGVDVDRFYRDLLVAFDELARAGGSAIGAAAVAKRVGLVHGVAAAAVSPLPRLPRAVLDELGLTGASRRRARGTR